MYCLNLPTTDPCFNLAAEEHLIRNSDKEYFILYCNSPSVIIGKHQSPHREADTEYVTLNNIPVVRRLSGGGTVYHDKNNLNFTFISNSEPGRQVDFARNTAPVIGFLASLGVNARLEGKNDLKVNGLKISGNAEHVHRNRVMHHGTLLFDSDLNALRSSLRQDTSYYITRAVSSNPSPVTNLKPLLGDFDDASQFRMNMAEYFAVLPGYTKDALNEQDSAAIDHLAGSKYRTWEWNYAYGPDYQIVKTIDYRAVMINFSMDVRGGIIAGFDSDSSDFLKRVGRKLEGTRHMVADMTEVLENENISEPDVFSFF